MYHFFWELFPRIGLKLIKKIIHFFLTITLFLLVQIPVVGAFSLGSIHVKSNFGERFLAEIELMTERDGNIEVRIGTQKDYDRLEIDRLEIVDRLRIDKLIKINRGKEAVRIVSDIPLFFPSFNLVIRASQDGGSLLENYLIAVDFQQTVSLTAPALKSEERKKGQKSISKKPVNLLEEVKADKPQRQNKNINVRIVRETYQPIFSKKIEKAREREPLGMNLRVKTPTPIAPMKPPMRRKKRSTDEAVGSPLAIIIPSEGRSSQELYSPLVIPRSLSQLEADGPRFKGTRQNVLKHPVLLADPDKASGKPVVSLSAAAFKNIGSQKIYGPLAEGETLSKIAAKLKVDPVNKKKVTVAIWLDNLDQFIVGNIHGIKKGAVLNLGQVHKRLEQLSGRTAHLILLNHWQEWKIIKAKLSGLVEKGDVSAIKGIFLPAEKIPDKAEVFRLLEKWRSSWENMNMARHMSCFSKWFRVMKAEGKDLDYADWKGFKQRMFGRHGKSKILVYRPKLIQMGDRVLVSFDQVFESKSLNSFGHKVLELIREPDGWKVISERFKLKPREEKGNLSKFVVHSSSHSRINEARQIVNQLREQGINAYFAPLNLTRSKQIYRVFVERFSEWTLAVKMARSLRSWKVGRYAVPEPIPFSLLAGSFGLEDQAAIRVEFLRKNGISSFLFSTSNRDFSHPVFNVMVGAYSREKETQGIKHQLAKLGIAFRLIAS